MKRYILTLIILLTLCTPATALNSQTGTTLGTSLKLGLGARATGMGDAFVAVADDASAILWNPAGLTQISSLQYLGMYTSWFQGIEYSAISIVQPIDQDSVGGLSISRLGISPIEETTRDNPGGTGRNFTASDLNIGVSYARKILPGLSLGCTIKGLFQNIDESVAQAASLDLGGLYNSPVSDLTVGFNLQNISYVSEKGSLPTILKVGAAYRMEKELTLAVDVNLPSDNQATYHLGVEYCYEGTLIGRIGYNTRQEEGAGGNLSAGIGLRIDGLNIDYAYVPYENLGNTHRLSITL